MRPDAVCRWVRGGVKPHPPTSRSLERPPETTETGTDRDRNTGTHRATELTESHTRTEVQKEKWRGKRRLGKDGVTVCERQRDPERQRQRPSERNGHGFRETRKVTYKHRDRQRENETPPRCERLRMTEHQKPWREGDGGL